MQFRRENAAPDRIWNDPDKLIVIEYEGERRAIDTSLGEAVGYERPRKIRELIERLSDKLSECGSLPHRGAVIEAGKGALHQVREYLLNQDQVNYLITRCGLPSADAYCTHVARVFSAWQRGELTANTLETAVALQDSAEATSVEAPAIAELSATSARDVEELPDA